MIRYLSAKQSLWSWILEDGIIKALDYSTDQGVGFRVVCGETTGYAFSEDMDVSVLQATALAARSIGENSQTVTRPAHAVNVAHSRLYTDVNPIACWEDTQKVQVLKDLERYARAASVPLKNVMHPKMQYEHVLIKRFDGQLVSDVRPLVRVDVHVICCPDGVGRPVQPVLVDAILWII